MPLASESDLDQIDQRLAAADVLVLDTETTGLRWQNCQTIGYVLTFSGYEQDSWYLPISHAGGGNLNRSKVNKMLKPHLKRQSLRVVGHHLKFDLHFLANECISVGGSLEDTMINSFLLNEHQRSLSLDYCCREYGVQEKRGEPLYQYMATKFGGPADRNQMKNFFQLAGDDPMVWDYAAGDGTSTWQLWEHQQKLLDAPLADGKNLRQIWDIECRVIGSLFRMERRGIRIDEERLSQVSRMVDQQMQIARSKLPKNFNERAPTQLKQYFTDAGITNWPLTEKKRLPSFPESWLITNELGQNIVKARKLHHLESSFLTPIKNRHLHKGRVHCSYNQTRGESDYGTVTGRTSCQDPNLQQVGKRDINLGPLHRSIFVPDEDMQWGSPDFNQCEPRLLAGYGRVKVLLEGYLSTPPIDAHSQVAKMAGIPRGPAKTVNQALLTGAGETKIKLMLQMPPEEADRIMQLYFSTMPEIKKIQNHARQVMLHRGFVRSILGRVARLDDPRYAYKALNRLLQCSNADIIKKAMVDIDDYLASEGGRVHMLTNIHDSLDFGFHETDRRVYEKALDVMQDFGPGRSVHWPVPMTVEEKSGPDWAVASYGEEVVEAAFTAAGSKYRRYRAAA